MTLIPPNEVTQADLDEWSNLTQQLAAIKAKEMLLRIKIFRAKFPNPVEGTNKFPLAAGWIIKATYPISRKPLVDLLIARAQELRNSGVPVDTLIKSTPELVVAEYRKLDDDKRHLFDQILEIKPGSPQLEITLPKRATPT
ncbi:hypothetical protein UFOVP1254_65 [uncultured Caudovirales phage]|uniref:Uncharacterized protein n=1 Tax=uncultured Caudovirales phage TaxID=2100421 RepID=A0A6J5RBS6_9CAUD|nr:hypothetical protein UFOVP1254_65 [uncultured Caudovirales phage]